MPVLRFREIASPNNKTLKPETTQPLNAPSSNESTQLNLLSDHLMEQDAETVKREDEKDKGILRLQSGKKIAKPRIGVDSDAVHLGLGGDVGNGCEVLNMKIEKDEMFDNNSYLDDIYLPGNVGVKELDIGLTSDEDGTVRKNKRKLSSEGKVEVIKVENVLELSRRQRVEDTGTGTKTGKYWIEGKDMENMFEDESLLENTIAPYTSPLLDNLGLEVSWIEPMASDNPDVKDTRALSRKDKGKDKVVENVLLSNVADPFDLSLSLGAGNADFEEEFLSYFDVAPDAVVHDIKEENDVVVNSSSPVLEDARNDVSNARGRVKERFRDIARKNASRFAHFSSQELGENHVNDQPVIEMTRVETGRKGEDWPGPFSIAMKIIKDRKSYVPVAQQSCSSNRSKPGSIEWVPRKDKTCHKQCIPKLQDLCINILAKNADAISSLESVPDVIRHKLSHILCDSRKMNAQFLDLLVCGSPTEIRIRDCSWLTEEEFTRAFQKCDASHLMVLQLDQCGRCLSDYLLSDILARSPNTFPVLTAISIRGACRLSDVGLSALLASAPALKSINLSQCSLLTCDGINDLADSLGSILRELYIDDCQVIDPMVILPALLKLKHLEVLSVAGIQTLSDIFVKELVAVRGQKLKELVFTDCSKLTDSSLKAIAETCTGLHALDLSNLYRLTDSTLEYLANGCKRVERLKLSRNAFSDEAIAAYIEASGESLKELSLNNIRQVGDDTAISLSRRSRNLLFLDLSWCRKLSNEALGLIVDSCLYLKVLKIFGCTQITKIFVEGHSNPQLQIIGLKMTPILKNLSISEPQQGPLHYSAVFS